MDLTIQHDDKDYSGLSPIDVAKMIGVADALRLTNADGKPNPDGMPRIEDTPNGIRFIFPNVRQTEQIEADLRVIAKKIRDARRRR